MRNYDYRRLSGLALALATFGAPHAGCGNESGLVTRPGEVGAVGFKLALPGGIDISKVAYAIKSSAGAVVKANEVLIGGPGTTFAAKIDRIPAGKGYTITMLTKDAGYNCSGSASFDIKPRETTTVAVRLRCPGKSDNSGKGSLLVEGDINVCPVIDNAVATPNGDGTYALSAFGSDLDAAPAALSYLWTASVGTIASATAANATFTCPAGAAAVSVTLQLKDGDDGCSDIAGTTETLTNIDCGAGTVPEAGSGTAGLVGQGGSSSGGAGAGGQVGAAGSPSGAGAPGSGPSTGAADGSSEECMTCRAQKCNDYQASGINLVSGCFDAIDTTLGASASDPTFLQQCIDFVDCAQANNCAYGANGASDCYCGSATPDTCINNGPAADAKCVPATREAARSSDNADITLRFTDLAYPLGWAYFLLECDSLFCESCKP